MLAADSTQLPFLSSSVYLRLHDGRKICASIPFFFCPIFCWLDGRGQTRVLIVGTSRPSTRIAGGSRHHIGPRFPRSDGGQNLPRFLLCRCPANVLQLNNTCSAFRCVSATIIWQGSLAHPSAKQGFCWLSCIAWWCMACWSSCFWSGVVSRSRCQPSQIEFGPRNLVQLCTHIVQDM